MPTDIAGEPDSPLPARARSIIQERGLASHPEGGYFGPCPLSRPVGADPRAEGEGGTCIFYLMIAGRGSGSMLHRLWDQTEVWRHVEGDPVALVHFSPTGSPRLQILGPDPGQTPSITIPDGDWQGARVRSAGGRGQGYSLVTCTVTPAYDGEKFEMASAAQIRSFISQFGADPQVKGALLLLLEDLKVS